MNTEKTQGKGNKVVATQQVNQGIANKLASGKTIKVRTYGVNAEINVEEVGDIIYKGNYFGRVVENRRMGHRLNCSIKLEYAGDIVNLKATIDLFSWKIWSIELRKYILGLAIATTPLSDILFEVIPNIRYKYYYPEEGNYKVVSKTKKVA